MPATMFVDPTELVEPLSAHHCRKVETSAQRTTLIQRLQEDLQPTASPQPEQEEGSAEIAPVSAVKVQESFGDPGDWDRLQKIGDWQLDRGSGVFQGKGTHNYLLSYFPYGKRPFEITAHLRFTELAPLNDVAGVNAGIVFGWQSPANVRRYYHLMFTGGRLLLELVGDRGEPVFRDFQHIDEGIPFALQSGRQYELRLSVDDRALTVNIDQMPRYSTSFTASPIGRVGLRPWRSRMESDLFQVKQI